MGGSQFRKRIIAIDGPPGAGKGTKQLPQGDFSFSEADTVNLFRGEHRELIRYIVDSVPEKITRNSNNRLMDFVGWAEKGAQKPLSYSRGAKTFYPEFLSEHPTLLVVDEACFIENGGEAFDVALASRVRRILMMATAAPSRIRRLTKNAVPVPESSNRFRK
jgi:hypothetical protein